MSCGFKLSTLWLAAKYTHISPQSNLMIHKLFSTDSFKNTFITIQTTEKKHVKTSSVVQDQTSRVWMKKTKSQLLIQVLRPLHLTRRLQCFTEECVKVALRCQELQVPSLDVSHSLHSVINVAIRKQCICFSFNTESF